MRVEEAALTSSTLTTSDRLSKKMSELDASRSPFSFLSPPPAHGSVCSYETDSSSQGIVGLALERMVGLPPAAPAATQATPTVLHPAVHALLKLPCMHLRRL